MGQRHRLRRAGLSRPASLSHADGWSRTGLFVQVVRQDLSSDTHWIPSLDCRISIASSELRYPVLSGRSQLGRAAREAQPHCPLGVSRPEWARPWPGRLQAEAFKPDAFRSGLPLSAPTHRSPSISRDPQEEVLWRRDGPVRNRSRAGAHGVPGYVPRRPLRWF
jgi:hypothetical protein